jgi:cbb3-type cytochrome oxidase cytochrome c subunit
VDTVTFRRDEMSRRVIFVLAMMLLVLLVGSLLAACSGAEEETIAPTTEQEKATPAAIEGRALLEERCTRCHDLARVEGARKTEEEWKATVERMVGKGAQLSQAEQEAVVKYLAETYPQ